jgi:hypothetical protein
MMERLANLKQFVKTQLPNNRERHALLEIVGLLEELVSKEPVLQEEIIVKKNRVKRDGKKEAVS